MCTHIWKHHQHCSTLRGLSTAQALGTCNSPAIAFAVFQLPSFPPHACKPLYSPVRPLDAFRDCRLPVGRSPPQGSSCQAHRPCPHATASSRRDRFASSWHHQLNNNHIIKRTVAVQFQESDVARATTKHNHLQSEDWMPEFTLHLPVSYYSLFSWWLAFTLSKSLMWVVHARRHRCRESCIRVWW
jgi:hypothetical protein